MKITKRVLTVGRIHRRILAAVLIPLVIGGSAAAAGAGEAGNVHVETTNTGVRFGTWGGPESGPAPVLVILANSIEGTLGEEYFRQAGRTLGDPRAVEPFLCVSIDLPCHGQERRPGEPPELGGWRHRLEQGDDPVADTATRLANVLDHLVAGGRVNAGRIAIIGTSRGGFMALQVAAREPRIACAVAYAPVTELSALREFHGAESLPAVSAAALREQAGRLAGRPVWITIGANDDRVGTDKTIAFAAAVHAAAVAQKVPDRLSLTIDGEHAGHTTPAAAAAQSADWIQRIMAAGGASHSPD
jgi:dienelactone hydrolase